MPVDFSASPPRAVRHARRIAPRATSRRRGTPSHVPFSRASCATPAWTTKAIHHYRIVAARRRWQKLQALRDQAGLPVAVPPARAPRRPTYRIIEQEQERHGHLAAMGKHGEGMLLKELFLGSVTKHALAESQGRAGVGV